MARGAEAKIKFQALDKMSKVISKIKNSFPRLSEKIKKANNAFKMLQERTAKVRQSLSKMSQALKRTGKDLTTKVTAPVVGFAALSIKSFADFEQGVVDVRKTTGLAFNEIEGLILNISKKIPIGIDALNEIAGAAGQLGVKGKENIEKFTETFAMLEKASDIAGEEGAKAVVRLLTITGEGIPVVDRFASTLVALGNNAAASESEILYMATRIGQAVSQFRVASKDILGIAAGMKSLGLPAEAAGTVIGKVFRTIGKSIDEGGVKFKALQKITGLSAEQLKQTFQKDPKKVFMLFLEGLKRLKKDGVSTSKVLDGFSLSGDRVNAIIPTMVENLDVVSDSVKLANKEFEKNTALQEEFAEQTKTFNSAMQKLSNSFRRFTIQIGAKLAPHIRKLADRLEGVFEWLEKHPTAAKWIAIFAAIAAVVGPLLILFGMMAGSIVKIITLFNMLTVGGGILKGNIFLPLVKTLFPKLISLFGFLKGGVVKFLSSALLPLISKLGFLRFGLIGALIGAAILLIKNWEPVKKFWGELFTDPIKKARELLDLMKELSFKSIKGFINEEILGGKSDVDKQLEAQGFKIIRPAEGQKRIMSKGADVTNRQIIKKEAKSTVDVNVRASKGTDVQTMTQSNDPNFRFNTGTM